MLFLQFDLFIRSFSLLLFSIWRAPTFDQSFDQFLVFIYKYIQVLISEGILIKMYSQVELLFIFVFASFNETHKTLKKSEKKLNASIKCPIKLDKKRFR